jgi:hypothetical protein
MEADVSELIDTEHGEQIEDRATHRTGIAPSRLDTRAGEMELQIPTCARARISVDSAASQALCAGAVLVERAHGWGVSTWRVDQIVRASLRIRSGVSRIAGLLNEQVRVVRGRPSRSRYPRCLFVDATSEWAAPAAASGASAWSWPMAFTGPAGGRSWAWKSARPRPRRSGATSCACSLVAARSVASDAVGQLQCRLPKLVALLGAEDD